MPILFQLQVLLIEAGPEEPEITSVPALAPVLGRSSIDWNYRTQPEEMTCRAQRGQTCAWLRYVEEEGDSVRAAGTDLTRYRVTGKGHLKE